MKRASTPPSAESAVTAPKSPAVNEASPEPDVALIHGVSADGGLRIIRRRGDRIEAGALHPVREGAPIHGELVALKPRESCPLICDVEVHYSPERPVQAAAAISARTEAASSPAHRKGPAQVASDAYRSNWDSIWSGAKKRDTLN